MGLTVYDLPSVTLFTIYSLYRSHCTDNYDNAGHGVTVLVQWFDNNIEYNGDFHFFIERFTTLIKLNVGFREHKLC